MSFLKRNLDGVAEDAVEDFALVLRKILNWLSMVIEIRCEDVVRRKDAIEIAK